MEETWAASGHEDLAWRNPLRYRAYYYDTATDLYYMPARYYDPETMRFLSPDPASPSAGDPLTLNRYAYCVGDPVNKSDPTGEIADWDGNGKADSWDVQYHMSRHTSNPKQAALWKAKAKVSYYSTQLAEAGEGRLSALQAAEYGGRLVDAIVEKASAWADLRGNADYYVDLSGSYVGGRFWGGAGGVMLNYRNGELLNTRPYAAFAAGPPGRGVSAMIGAGHVPPGARYFELAGGLASIFHEAPGIHV